MQFVSSPRGEKKGGHSGGTNEVSDEESRICHSESCPKLVSATQSSHAELVSASRIFPETLRKTSQGDKRNDRSFEGNVFSRFKMCSLDLKNA